MTGPRGLRINADFCSRKGRRNDNQDFVGLCCDGQDAMPGHVVAIADGVSFSAGGRTAAELAVRTFIEAHCQSSPTHGVARNAARALAAYNAWLHAAATADDRLRNACTTFTAMVLTGREAHVIHVGDTRAYLLHDGELVRLTVDHTLQQAERDHVLLRAVGMEASVRADHSRHGLRVHDRLLLCTDGVHASLADARLRALLQRRRSPGEDAAAIVDAALEAGSQDNVSCAVIDVLEVPDIGAGELFEQVTALPMVAPPVAGTVIDGFRIHAQLADGRYSRLLRATDVASGDEVVLKFPQADVAPASTYHLAFVREAWVAARLHSPFIGESVVLAPGRQSCLYSVMPYYAGETLEDRLQHPPVVGLAEGIGIALKLVRALAALHRARIIHRDIKP